MIVSVNIFNVNINIILFCGCTYFQKWIIKNFTNLFHELDYLIKGVPETIKEIARLQNWCKAYKIVVLVQHTHHVCFIVLFWEVV